MKSTTNAFLDGMVTDFHPLSTPANCLTDALNATLLTYNGNEQMLQNDMGNTLIQDTATGNIMGLSPGFVPIGIKEHGGIMYIASVNKEGEGQLGTIPSPIIRDLYKASEKYVVEGTIPTYPAAPAQISYKLYPADKFMLNLQMEFTPGDVIGEIYTENDPVTSTKDTNDPADTRIRRWVLNSSENSKGITSPFLSFSSTDNPENLTYTKGIYSVRLHSTSGNSTSAVDAAGGDLLKKQMLDNGQESNYWFTHTPHSSLAFPKDLMTASLNNNLKRFPTTYKPGYLAVSVEKEAPQSFGMISRQESPFNVPYTYKVIESGKKPRYYTYFPGFYYTTNSGIYIDKVVSTVTEELSGQAVDLLNPYSAGVSKSITSRFTKVTPEPTTVSKISPSANASLFSISTSSPDKVYPQDYYQKAVSGTSQYLLTNLPDITNPAVTTCESSESASPKKHSGLFCADLGENWNRWLVLTSDYYDQYGDKQGTFSCRFNPYVNDVFGSNLSADAIEEAPVRYDMGQDKKLQFTLTGSGFTLPNFKDIVYKKAYKGGHTYYSAHYKWMDESTKVKVGGSNSITLSTSVSTQINNIKVSVPSMATYNYLFKDVYNTKFDWTYTWNKDVTLPRGNSSTFYVDGITDSSMFLLGANSNLNWVRCQKVKEIDGKWVLAIKYSEFNGKGYNFDPYTSPYSFIIGTNTRASYNPTQVPDSVTLPSAVDASGQKQLSASLSKTSETRKSVSLKGIDNTNYTTSSITASSSVSGMIGALYFADLDGKPATEDGHLVSDYWSDDGDGINWSYGPTEAGSYLDWSFNLQSLRSSNPTTAVTVTSNDVNIKPAYSILPYILLKGTNDLQQSVYVTKLHADDDLWYESNLEIDPISSYPKNYYTTQTTSSSVSIDRSYNTSTPVIDTTSTPLTESTAIGTGVYVLNVTRTENASATITMKITVNGITTNLDSKQLIQAAKSTYSGVSGTHSQNVYVPIVIVSPSSQFITIEIAGCVIQQIGLYKIADSKDFVSNSTFTDAIPASIYTWPQYQKMVSDAASGLATPAQQRVFIQKYGVFFRQAYTYLEMLQDKSAGLKSITNVNSSGAYVTTTYSCANPYIIDYVLNSNLVSISSCFYCMTTDVLNKPSDSPSCVFYPTSKMTSHTATNASSLSVRQLK